MMSKEIQNIAIRKFKQFQITAYHYSERDAKNLSGQAANLSTIMPEGHKSSLVAENAEPYGGSSVGGTAEGLDNETKAFQKGAD